MNPVLIWYNNLLQPLERVKRGGSLKDREGVVDNLLSLLKEMEYSYLPCNELVTLYSSRIRSLAEKLKALPYPNRDYLDYVLEELLDFERKCSLSPKEPYQVLRYRFVKVEEVRKHPSLDLLVLRVSGGFEGTLVTNLEDVRKGENLLVVLLPPRDFEGITSRAMIVQRNVSSPKEVDVERLRELNHLVLKPPL